MFGLRPGFGKEAAEADRDASVQPPAPPPVRDPTDRIYESILAEIEPDFAMSLTQPELTHRVQRLVNEAVNNERLPLGPQEQESLTAEVLNDLIGFGPLENLLRDDTVSDILVNGPRQIYVERRGQLELTGLQFRDDRHVVHLAQRIASSVGRRVDESSPMLDARLADGSRVNVVIAPAILSGPSISIRKFSRSLINFARMIELNSISQALGRVLEIAAHCRLNILISGGAGSGKTTLLNALSGFIDERERVVTIEDTAELQLQQPHVLRLENRPPDRDGKGEITQRDLLHNALRMRPDRIIVGEVRGPEAFDMLQAMNTGHSGSMSTLHANSTRDALVRLENMVLIANPNLPLRAIRSQIVSALDLVLQVERLRDGSRRVTELSEVVSMEEEIITLSSLFTFEYEDTNSEGAVRGTFVPSGLRPRFLKRLKPYGLVDAYLSAVNA
jgi:pilus assembly protein CpaF